MIKKDPYENLCITKEEAYQFGATGGSKLLAVESFLHLSELNECRSIYEELRNTQVKTGFLKGSLYNRRS